MHNFVKTLYHLIYLKEEKTCYRYLKCMYSWFGLSFLTFIIRSMCKKINWVQTRLSLLPLTFTFIEPDITTELWLISLLLELNRKRKFPKCFNKIQFVLMHPFSSNKLPFKSLGGFLFNTIIRILISNIKILKTIYNFTADNTRVK